MQLFPVHNTPLAVEIILSAIRTGKLDDEYVDVDRHHRGTALNYDLYDLIGATVVIQRRFTRCTKHGNSPTKDYFLVQTCGKGVIVKDINKYKPSIVKLAKSKLKLGAIVDLVKGKPEGKQQCKIKTSMHRKSIGYKAVCKNAEGNLISVWDGSDWSIGKTRTEAATSNHSGGYYFFATLAQCVAMAKDQAIFGEAREHKDLVFIEVEVAGNIFQYDNGKLCASRMKPLRIIN